MINLGSIYLIVRDFEKSVGFYKELFERDVIAQNKNRFAIFDVEGFSLSIMNGYFDKENPDKVITKGKNYSEYDDYVRIAKAENTGKVVINLATNNLKNEYNRLIKSGVCENITEIRYINAKSPYYYFTLKDPDNNTIEITGTYDETKDGII